MVINVLTNFAFAGFSGGGIAELLAKWEQAGIFTYVLPFLLIFALVFAILSRMKIFADNKGVNVIIALVVGLMALQFDFVPRFFSEVFPRLGVGLSIILILLIMIGMFMDPSKSGLMGTLMAVGAIIAIVIFLNTAGALGWSAGDWWKDNIGEIIFGIIILVLVGWVIFKGSGSPKSEWKSLGFHE